MLCFYKKIGQTDEGIYYAVIDLQVVESVQKATPIFKIEEPIYINDSSIRLILLVLMGLSIKRKKLTVDFLGKLFGIFDPIKSFE